MTFDMFTLREAYTHPARGINAPGRSIPVFGKKAVWKLSFLRQNRFRDSLPHCNTINETISPIYYGDGAEFFRISVPVERAIEHSGAVALVSAHQIAGNICGAIHNDHSATRETVAVNNHTVSINVIELRKRVAITTIQIIDIYVKIGTSLAGKVDGQGCIAVSLIHCFNCIDTVRNIRAAQPRIHCSTVSWHQRGIGRVPKDTIGICVRREQYDRSVYMCSKRIGHQYFARRSEPNFIVVKYNLFSSGIQSKSSVAVICQCSKGEAALLVCGPEVTTAPTPARTSGSVDPPQDATIIGATNSAAPRAKLILVIISPTHHLSVG